MAYYVQLFVCSCSLKLLGWRSFLWQSRFALLGHAVVVADSRAPRDGRIIEEVGRYNPMTAPKTINLDLEKIADWQSKGAQLTDAVAALVKAANEGEKTETVVKKSKKQLAKEAEAAKAAAEAAEGAEE